MVVRVTWRMHCSDSGALNTEYLSVCNRQLVFAGRVLVDCGREVGTEAKKVGNPADVITMPMGQEYMGQGDRGVSEGGRDQICPFGDALGRVYDESPRARTDNVCVCTLECKLEAQLAS